MTAAGCPHCLEDRARALLEARAERLAKIARRMLVSVPAVLGAGLLLARVGRPLGVGPAVRAELYFGAWAYAVLVGLAAVGLFVVSAFTGPGLPKPYRAPSNAPPPSGPVSFREGAVVPSSPLCERHQRRFEAQR